jgi:hypothetical protein
VVRRFAGGERDRIRLTGRLLISLGLSAEARMGRETGSKLCPQCGKGVLVDVAHDESPGAASGDQAQVPEARQVETYSCGHELAGPRLDVTAAGSEDLVAERRGSEETTEPL